jgi:uncharacterized repeat protein (TIGR03803 family)
MILRKLITLCALMFVSYCGILFLSAAQKRAQTATILYSFGGSPTDGSIPYAGLTYVGTSAKRGYLYGLAYSGGTRGGGTAYKISTTGQYQVIYNFGSQPGDGCCPVDPGGLLASGGKLYGTTLAGGVGDQAAGTVFELTPQGNEKTLYTFTDTGSPGDIGFLSAGVAIDKQGNLYGSSSFGGAFGYGAVFQLNPAGEEKLLWSFGGDSGDGQNPGGVVLDRNGNVYGTTQAGGDSGNGTVFEITAAGDEKVLYSFQGPPNDGATPYSPPIFDGKGNLFGTTYGGGKFCGAGCGTVFKLSPQGSESVLWNFGQPGDGTGPYASLIFDSTGNLYGTTSEGGSAANCGTVFELTPNGTEKVLYAFGNSPDGCVPSGVVFDASGNFYGTTSFGGAHGGGTVFKIVP